MRDVRHGRGWGLLAVVLAAGVLASGPVPAATRTTRRKAAARPTTSRPTSTIARPTTSAAPTTTIAPTTTLTPVFTPTPITWTPCSTFECATVEVPRDHQRPTQGPWVKLTVLRAKATPGGTRIGSLFVYPGGPGGSSVASAQQLARRLPAEVLRRFDIVGVDSRGLERSTPLRCGNTVDLSSAADARARYVASCQANAPDSIATTDSETNARDLDMVRAAMGEESITFLGYSYGGQLGRAYATLFPSRVRAMILDSPTDPGTAPAQRVIDQFEARESTLASFLQYCSVRPGCAFNDGSDLRTRYDTLAAQIAGQPIAASTYVLDRRLFEILVDDQLRADSLWPNLGLILRDLAVNRSLSRVTPLVQSLDISSTDPAVRDNSLAVYLSTICGDGFLPGSRAELDDLAARIPQVAPHFATRLDSLTANGTCAGWPVPARPLRPVSTPPAGPTLVITSVWDLTTPHEWGQQLAQSIGAAILPVDRTGHGIFPGLSCVDAIATRFLVDLTPPVVGTRCA